MKQKWLHIDITSLGLSRFSCVLLERLFINEIIPPGKGS